ncbi:capsid [Audaxivirus yotargis]|uniref:Capsid n=1 Tax=Circovirus sp. TaxID=1964372 RepID=A0A2S0D902_9CIRC|nr:capsid [Circovirus sp.]QRV11701.1 capsid [Bat associated circovirus]
MVRLYKRRRFARKIRHRVRKFRTRIRRPIGSGDSGKRFFKIRRTDPLVMVANTNLSVNRTDDPSTAQNWSNISGLFDYYRVCAIKIHFIPTSNVLTFPIAAAGPRFSAIYVIHDVNSTSSVSSVSAVIQYGNLVLKNLWMPWKKYYKMKRNIPAAILDNVSTSGYLPTSTPTGTQSVQAFIPTIGTQSSGEIGTLITTYYLVCRNII